MVNDIFNYGFSQKGLFITFSEAEIILNNIKFTRQINIQYMYVTGITIKLTESGILPLESQGNSIPPIYNTNTF